MTHQDDEKTVDDEFSRVAVRAPEYWPRPAFVALALRVDELYLADTFQYSRQSFHNRARLRNPNGWQWISVPLEGGQHGEPIAKARINNSEPWQPKHWRALIYNYRSSPYFEYYEPRFEHFFESTWETLGALSCGTVELLLDLLECPCEVVRTSSLPEKPNALSAFAGRVEGRVVLTLPDAAGYDEGVLPARVQVVETELPPYRQNFEGFEPGMSTLDVLFNYGPATLQMLREASKVVSAAARRGKG